MAEEPPKKNPLREITQPFIDLIHAPRALWGVNLAYVIEGMVYFGMLGYLAIYFSDYVFQGVEHADEYSHNNVMVLTAGITIAMFFLGSVADKWGIRFALIAAFVCMLAGRVLISGGPNILGFKPARAGVLVDDKVGLHVTELGTVDGVKAITKATLIANENDAADVDRNLAINLSAGQGVTPGKKLESKLVTLPEAKVLSGKANSWTIEYGSAGVKARLLARPAADLCVCPGAVISLKRAYVAARKGDSTSPTGTSSAYVLRCHWAQDFGEVDTTRCVDAEDAEILNRLEGLRAGDPSKAVERIVEVLQANHRDELAPQIVEIVQSNDSAAWTDRVLALLQANPRQVRNAQTANVCEQKVGHYEAIQKPRERSAVSGDVDALSGVTKVGLTELSAMANGPVNLVVPDVFVTYVRNGGYFVQSDKESPAMEVVVDPVWSPLHFVTLLGILGVVIGYGMYQPAAYAAVRQFTTPKTAGMAFAMLYALMNLGGWLPSFAFLLRDEEFLGLGIPGTFWIYTVCTVLALIVTVAILSKRTVSEAIQQAKKETSRIQEAKNKSKTDVEGVTKNVAETTARVEEAQVPPIHLWLLAFAFLCSVYWKVSAPWGLYAVAVLGALWVIGCLFPPTGRWLAKHPLADIKFFFFIFALIPVQTLFTYNWLILPQYISRAFEGWIGEYFEIASNANPLLIFIAVPLIAAATQKAKVYNMMIVGTFVMAAPAFLLAIGPYTWTLFGYLLVMTIGEAMWQPRFLQYAAEIAPEGRTGQYMGVAQLPWFLTKMLVPWLYSGWAMDRFCPAEGVRHTEVMWFYFGCIAIVSSLILMVAKGWVGKDFRTMAD